MNSSLILFTAQICLSVTCLFFWYIECPNSELGELGKNRQKWRKRRWNTYLRFSRFKFLSFQFSRKAILHHPLFSLLFLALVLQRAPTPLTPISPSAYRCPGAWSGWEGRKDEDEEEMERWGWWKRGICCKWVVGELSCNDCTCPYFWTENRLTSFLSCHLSSRKSLSSHNLFIIYTWSSFSHSFPYFTHFPCYSPNLRSFETNHFLLSLTDFVSTDFFIHWFIFSLSDSSFSQWFIFAFKN